MVWECANKTDKHIQLKSDRIVVDIGMQSRVDQTNRVNKETLVNLIKNTPFSELNGDKGFVPHPKIWDKVIIVLKKDPGQFITVIEQAQ